MEPDLVHTLHWLFSGVFLCYITIHKLIAADVALNLELISIYPILIPRGVSTAGAWLGQILSHEHSDNAMFIFLTLLNKLNQNSIMKKVLTHWSCCGVLGHASKSKFTRYFYGHQIRHDANSAEKNQIFIFFIWFSMDIVFSVFQYM